MAARTWRSGAVLFASALSVTLAVAACGASQVSDTKTTDAAAGSDTAAASGDSSAAAGGIDCSVYTAFGDLKGKTVTVYASIVAPEDQPYIDSFKPFEDCTGATVSYEGSKEFEAQLVVRAKSGNAPDIALVPQPGLLQTLVRDTGAVKPAPKEVAAAVDKLYGADWKTYGTVDGTFYAAPNSANVKSFVWYSPKAFADKGYKVPTTWDELIALSDQIVKDNPDGSVKPWCAGIGSGNATGWPTTDWMEDVMLRVNGPDVYDQWVDHSIPFNDPKVAAVLAKVGTILKNPAYVNGGLGDVKSIASTTFQDGGLPILTGKCFMHRQASFYAANWPEGTKVAEDGDVFAFYFPAISKDFGNPVLGGGEFIAAFADRPEVQAFQLYMTSKEFINKRATYGQFIPPNSSLDINNLTNPIDKLSAQLLNDPNATFRFDGSDLMPAAVGSGSFWKEMTAWIAEDKSDKDVLDAIESSWPKS